MEALVSSSRYTWTKEEDKIFESALAFLEEGTPNKWFKVAALIPGKSVHDVVKHYLELVADVNDIEAGLVPTPGYLSSSSFMLGFDVCSWKRSGNRQRKKGVPWTEEEHRRFLLGLEKHGKGDWKNISRNYVVSKTPTQVASHAQKYYLRRQLSSSGGGKTRLRPSIHDLPVVVDDHRLLHKPPPPPNELASLVHTPAHQQWNHMINTDGLINGFTDSLIANPSCFHYVATTCLL